MAFHDIAYPDEDPAAGQVGLFWRELAASGKYLCKDLSNLGAVSWGIGVIWK